MHTHNTVRSTWASCSNAQDSRQLYVREMHGRAGAPIVTNRHKKDGTSERLLHVSGKGPVKLFPLMFTNFSCSSTHDSALYHISKHMATADAHDRQHHAAMC